MPRGRPIKAPTPGTRVSLGLKVTPEIKRRLDQAARDSGRTQSQEAELRIEQSFRNDNRRPRTFTVTIAEVEELDSPKVSRGEPGE